MKIGVFSADRRMELLCERLKKEGEVISIEENDSMTCLKLIAAQLDALIFPPWGIDDSGFVRMKSRGIYVLEMLGYLKKSCVIFSGQDHPLLRQYNHRVHCWLDDEDIVMKNAELTALGVLGKLISIAERSLKEVVVDVIGTGRCAKACADLFERLNVSYRFVSRHPEPFMIDCSQWLKSNPNDIIINTAPVCMIDQEVMDHWKSMKTVIDLASGFPFVNSACLKHPFLKLIQMKAVPAQYTPISAAELICQYVLKEIRT